MSAGGRDPLRELARLGKNLYRRVAEVLRTPPEERDPALTPARIRDEAVRALLACVVDVVEKRHCRLCVTPYPADERKLRELLVAEGVERLYDERGELVVDVGTKKKKKNVSVRFDFDSAKKPRTKAAERSPDANVETGSDDDQTENENRSAVRSDEETRVKSDPGFVDRRKDSLDSVEDRIKIESDSGDDFHEKIKYKKKKSPSSHSKHRRRNESGSDKNNIEEDLDKNSHKKAKHHKKVGFALDSKHHKKSSESDDSKIASNSSKKLSEKLKARSSLNCSDASHNNAKSRNKICSDSDDSVEKATASKSKESHSKKIKRIVSSDSEEENIKTKIGIQSDSRTDPNEKSKVYFDSDDENKKADDESKLESKALDSSVGNKKIVSDRENCTDSTPEIQKESFGKGPSETADSTVTYNDTSLSDGKEYISNSESENEYNNKRKRSARKKSFKRLKVKEQSTENGKDAKDSDSDLKKSSQTNDDHKLSSNINKSSDEDEIDLIDGMKNDFVSNYSSLMQKRVMSEVASQIINGDSSNSDEESVPKVNGKMKKSSEINASNNSEMDHSNSHDEKAKAKKSKKSKRTISPLLIDSDSDVRSNDNGDKVSVKSDNDVKEILGSSESEDSDVFKPSKQRRKKKDSDKSDESESDQKPKKKRRRIKNVSGDESDKSGDESGSDEGDGTKKGRKNIRKVKRSDNLDEATKIAARNERERVQRIAERQKLYNESMFDESGRPDEVKPLDKVVLDFYPESKEPLISVDKGLVEKLKPHQANGVKFMWNACFESVSQIKKGKGSGCILAHCMGLGKTLQIVTLTHTLLTHQKLTKVERVLVVCPLSTVHNWVNEFTMWLKFAKCKDEIDIYEISKYKQNYERASRLKDWLENGGVCVLGYDMFRNLSADNNKKFRKTQLLSFQKALVDPGPDMVVCDEGHLLKNEKTSLSQSMNKVKTLRRIVLTGTPLQNNLKEYYCMVQFVKPNLLGKYNEYLNRFVNPITNGQYTDSTEHDIRVMKRRSHVLHKMLDGAVQRRDYSVLAPFLPPKHEYVLFISLTEIQIKLYSYYMENFSRRPQPDKKNTGFLFPDFQALQRIWTHPLVLKANSERYEIMQQKKREKEEDSEGSLVDFINDESTTPEETTEEEESSEDSDESDNTDKKKKKNKKAVPKRVTRATVVDDDEDDVIITKEEEPQRTDNPTEWWISLCSEDELDDVRHSNKLILLLDILKECEAIGDKLLVFSQSLYSLDLIEQFLWKIDEATQKGEDDQKLAGHLGSWSPGIDYFRLDGSTSCENRSIWCKNFNREDNPRARLFLISTRAGGLGINLVAANRVVIFDMSWNPSHDVQSIFRVYRFGQKKPCYIYRFLALGTMEEKIYERQVTKQAISKRVIDEQQIDRHYAESDLAELYTFCPVPEGSREVPKLPKDRLFADLLKQHDTMIYKYHEHDSLLENKEEETLTEEERKAAWEDYENEKTRPPTIFGGQVLAGFQQQQQHHLAMSALLQQENPSLSEQQVASMIPGLLQHMYQNGDPSLMQRMTAMLSAQNSMMGFKYPQSTMMNANLSSMLNAGTGSTGTFGGNSWQQQQQIQLQRLQQQQNMQANMKYYAGGLGSRDTLDMAALQQQQRAMLMASNANLPQRGRPPKNPTMLPYMQPLNMPKKTPPVTTGDVVDLDSE